MSGLFLFLFLRRGCDGDESVPLRCGQPLSTGCAVSLLMLAGSHPAHYSRRSRVSSAARHSGMKSWVSFKTSLLSERKRALLVLTASLIYPRNSLFLRRVLVGDESVPLRCGQPLSTGCAVSLLMLAGSHPAHYSRRSRLSYAARHSGMKSWVSFRTSLLSERKRALVVSTESLVDSQNTLFEKGV
jgi:hypothetical protein